MAFPSSSRRRFGNPVATAADTAEGPPEGGPGGRGPRNDAWVQSVTLYSDLSCMELGVIAGFYNIRAYVKVAHVQDSAATPSGNRRYNHDDAIFLTLSPLEVVELLSVLEQVEARDTEWAFEQTRNEPPHRVLIGIPASDLPDAPDSWSLVHAIYLQQFDQGLTDEVEPSREIGFLADWPDDEKCDEIEMLKWFCRSFLGGIARLDFASVHSLNKGGRGGLTAPSVASPTGPRRTGPARPSINPHPPAKSAEPVEQAPPEEDEYSNL